MKSYPLVLLSSTDYCVSIIPQSVIPESIVPESIALSRLPQANCPKSAILFPRKWSKANGDMSVLCLRGFTHTEPSAPLRAPCLLTGPEHDHIPEILQVRNQ
ncbi:hypothetical protein FJTKL_11153 [Diaporthe vaccinii]|uniref:Uncharacterized protein n=1 Tax=Diaporthe vaccinii TaxID=105482 RepID=A0ABR4EI73_9PEZI